MIIPTNQNVLVKPLEREVKTGSGIILGNTSSMEEGLKLGEVVQPGETTYKQGQKVFYSAYSAVWVTDENSESFQMISGHDIMGIEE